MEVDEVQPATRDGGKYEFDDGGCYCGQWEDGKAHGHGVCTGPKGQGEYSGSWHYGYEVTGVYAWPSGTVFEGQWQNGKRHGLGLERRGRWIYRGEWSQGFMGRYGVRVCRSTQAKYEGTWQNGLQDGYGTETYADGGTYQGQWCRGMRHGYGVRKSAPYGVAAKMRSKSHAHASLTSIRSEMGDDAADKDQKIFGDESRGGFALRAHSEPPTRRRSLSERSVAVKRTLLTGFRIKKNRSTSDIHQRVASAGGTGETPRSIRSSGSTASCTSDESGLTGSSQAEGILAPDEAVDPSVIETYYGEWKNDRRSGFGVSDRSDGLRYEGEWFNNRKYGYGVTSFKDGSKEEGKYKNNVLILSQRKKNLLFVRASKMRERIDSAVAQATRAAQTAVQKAEIAASRMATARDRATEAELLASQSREDSNFARLEAKRLAPDFHQPGTEMLKRYKQDYANSIPYATSAALFQANQMVMNPAANAAGRPNVSASHQSQRSRSLVIPKPQLSTEVENGGFIPEPSGALTPPAESALQQFQSIQTTIEAPPSQQTNPPLNQNMADVYSPPPPPELADRTQYPSKRVPSNYSYTESQYPGVVLRQKVPQNAQHMDLTTNAILEGTLPQNQPLQNYGPIPNAGPGITSHSNYQNQVPWTQHGHPAATHPEFRSQADILRNNPLVNPDSSSSVSQSPSRDSSRFSILGDHFDQYATAANPVQAKLIQQRQQHHFRQTSSTSGPKNRNELSKAGLNIDPRYSSEDMSPTGSNLIRRSTLATPEDRKTIGSTIGNTHTSGAVPRTTNPYGPGSGRLIDEPSLPMQRTDSKQSLPGAEVLEHSPVAMSRNEVSRLSSQRREEIRRMREEQELLRGNPLRYLLHPAVKEWILNRKLFIIVIVVNLGLSIIFQRLLSYAGKDDDDDFQAPD